MIGWPYKAFLHEQLSLQLELGRTSWPIHSRHFWHPSGGMRAGCRLRLHCKYSMNLHFAQKINEISSLQQPIKFSVIAQRIQTIRRYKFHKIWWKIHTDVRIRSIRFNLFHNLSKSSFWTSQGPGHTILHHDYASLPEKERRWHRLLEWWTELTAPFPLNCVNITNFRLTTICTVHKTFKTTKEICHRYFYTICQARPVARNTCWFCCIFRC